MDIMERQSLTYRTKDFSYFPVISRKSNRKCQCDQLAGFMERRHMVDCL